MAKNIDKLSEIMQLIAQVIDGDSLSSEESFKVFTYLFLYDIEGLHTTAFLAGLHAKGETADELLGMCLAHKKLSIKLNPKIDNSQLIDVSGTGGGSFKTINVSTAASFVLASAGITIGKTSYYGITSPTGSADVFEAFGIDISKLTRKVIENCLEDVGICPFYAPFISPKLANRGKVSRKIFGEYKLNIRTPFHLATNAFSPLDLKYRVYGCYSKRYLNVLGDLFFKLGFKKAFVVHGEIGIPEVSNVGKTHLIEQDGDSLKKTTLRPKDFGVEEAKKDQIKSKGKTQNIADFVRILKGEDVGPKADLVAINAGVAFYCLGLADSFKDGTSMAQRLLKEGEPYVKFEQLVKILGNPGRLKKFDKFR